MTDDKIFSSTIRAENGLNWMNPQYRFYDMKRVKKTIQKTEAALINTKESVAAAAAHSTHSTSAPNSTTHATYGSTTHMNNTNNTNSGSGVQQQQQQQHSPSTVQAWQDKARGERELLGRAKKYVDSQKKEIRRRQRRIERDRKDWRTDMLKSSGKKGEEQTKSRSRRQMLKEIKKSVEHDSEELNQAIQHLRSMDT